MKSLINWESRLEIGIGELDQQHWHLIALVNRLYHDVIDEQEPAQIRDDLNRLIGNTEQHFSREEALMIGCGYPDYADHKKQHRELLESTLDFQLHLEGGTAELTSAVLIYIRSWLLRHIASTDNKFGQFCAANRLLSSESSDFKPYPGEER